MENQYLASEKRYDTIKYNRCGNSGLLLPAVSLGLWHNFGFADNFQNCRDILRIAFDSGITHFDLANNYGSPYGSAEENFGRIFQKDFRPYRDELIISTKAGYDMWPGPYGNWGSRKYLLASLKQSLKRMQLEYVDIFYSHRPDPETPLEETMTALADAVKQDKALYAGLSNYSHEQTEKASAILKNLGVPCLIHQPKYSMFVRQIEEHLLDTLENNGIGCIAFSPLAEGLLTGKYCNGIPENSRAAKAGTHLKPEHITRKKIAKARELNDIAKRRNQSLAQMAIAWLLKDKRITSVLIGASSVKQLNENLGALSGLSFTPGELDEIEAILSS